MRELEALQLCHSDAFEPSEALIEATMQAHRPPPAPGHHGALAPWHLPAPGCTPLPGCTFAGSKFSAEAVNNAL